MFEKAAKYNIPVKYASSASVYGNEQGIINPLNYYALSKVTVDYWVQDNIDDFLLFKDLDTLMFMEWEKNTKEIKQVHIKFKDKLKKLANLNY